MATPNKVKRKKMQQISEGIVHIRASFNNTLITITDLAGNKITHNVTGKLGTMQGNASDLCLGLSYQSVYDNNRNLFHQPIYGMEFINH